MNLDRLLTTLPPIIARNNVSHYTGGAIAANYMANLDSDGKGPKRFKIGKKVAYVREDFVEWLKSRCE